MTPDPARAPGCGRGGRVNAALTLSLVVQVALLVVWAVCAARPGDLVELTLVGLSAVAMGIQTAVAPVLVLATLVLARLRLREPR